MALYILERLSSWSTSRIHLSWPRSKGRLSLLLVLFSKVYSSLLSPTQYLAICSNGSYFTLNPFFAYWLPNTSVQVNNTSYTHRHTYLRHININIHSLLHTSSTPSGRPAAPDPSRQAQWHCDSVTQITPLQIPSWLCYKTSNYKTPNYKTPNYKTPNFKTLNHKTPNCKTLNYKMSNLTERRILQNVEIQKVESYRTSKYKTSTIQNVEKMTGLDGYYVLKLFISLFISAISSITLCTRKKSGGIGVDKHTHINNWDTVPRIPNLTLT